MDDHPKESARHPSDDPMNKAIEQDRNLMKRDDFPGNAAGGDSHPDKRPKPYATEKHDNPLSYVLAAKQRMGPITNELWEGLKYARSEEEKERLRKLYQDSRDLAERLNTESMIQEGKAVDHQKGDQAVEGTSATAHSDHG